MINIISLDHCVLTVRDLEATIAFYTKVLDMKVVTFSNHRKALTFGQQKINLHVLGKEFEPKAHCPTPGSADLCFLSNDPIEEVWQKLKRLHIDILEGPVVRTGAQGPIRSVYIRDPDLNLIEIAQQLEQ